MSHLKTPSSVTARLSVVFSHALLLARSLCEARFHLPVGRVPRGSSRLPGTHWCCLAYELLLSAAWHSLVPPGLSAFPPEHCCSLARRPHLASGTLPSRSAVSQPIPHDACGHGGSTTAYDEAPTFRQWDPAFSLSDALWHCPRGISFHMPLALTMRRPHLASGTRPSRPAGRNPSLMTSSATAFGVRPQRFDEAPTLSQWDPAFPSRWSQPPS